MACALPLVAHAEPLDCVWLERRSASASIEGSDLRFLQVLATQLALALDRSPLVRREKERQLAEQHRLREEVETLRAALQERKLVYRSPQIESILGLARTFAERRPYAPSATNSEVGPDR